jgi:hypothetical protein
MQTLKAITAGKPKVFFTIPSEFDLVPAAHYPELIQSCQCFSSECLVKSRLARYCRKQTEKNGRFFAGVLALTQRGLIVQTGKIRILSQKRMNFFKFPEIGVLIEKEGLF